MSEQVEIAQYAAQVGAALADLPEQARNDLLEDLPAHLAEVAAEIEAEGGGATLTERLGPPSAYAAELRATLGHTGVPAGRSPGPGGPCPACGRAGRGWTAGSARSSGTRASASSWRCCARPGGSCAAGWPRCWWRSCGGTATGWACCRASRAAPCSACWCWPCS
ncbi:hypothetical protein ACFQZ4_20580 [Catellatospora coxensis]